MHDSFSTHNESIQSHAAQIWPHRYRLHSANFRPSLNVKQLVTLLQVATSEDALDSSTSAGKKRTAAVLSYRQGVRTSKRVKLSDGTITRGMSDTLEESTDDFAWPATAYPEVSSETEHYDKSVKDVEALPTFQHVSEIRYSRAPPGSMAVNGDDRLRSAWETEETYLLEILAKLRNSIPEPRTIDLGRIHFAEYLGRLVAKGRAGWLLLLPSLSSDTNLEWHGIASQSVKDILKAFYILQSAGRVRMNGRLNMIVQPSNDDCTEFPFRLQVVVDVSLLVPSIFEPLTTRGTKRTLLEIGDAQRRVLNFLYPSATPIPDTYDGAINIPFFYSILRSAQPTLSPSALEAIQPVELLPTLLPFQRRSVAWLLHREGKTITVDGELVPNVASEDFTLWDKVEQGNHTWYLHRLSGLLSPTLPQMPPVLGGILAEEPGLGKTLETIALILLNPAPLDRNPTVKRWDPEAKLEVRAIKVCTLATL
jgi:E3 ubiquitin-protein ligase SHPRH